MYVHWNLGTKLPSEAFFPSTPSELQLFVSQNKDKAPPTLHYNQLSPTNNTTSSSYSPNTRRPQLFVSLSSLISNAPYGEYGGATMPNTKRRRARSLLITLQSDGDFQGLSDPFGIYSFFFFIISKGGKKEKMSTLIVSKSVHKCLAGSTCGLAEKRGPFLLLQSNPLHCSGPTIQQARPGKHVTKNYRRRRRRRSWCESSRGGWINTHK